MSEKWTFDVSMVDSAKYNVRCNKSIFTTVRGEQTAAELCDILNGQETALNSLTAELAEAKDAEEEWKSNYDRMCKDNREGAAIQNEACER